MKKLNSSELQRAVDLYNDGSSLGTVVRLMKKYSLYVIKRELLAVGIQPRYGCPPKHGFSGSPIYRVWGDMISRCNSSTNTAYPNYGGRGIRVCRRWLKFEYFLADMGFPPKGKSLDRVDNNGNYKKSNCRWATRFEQENNKRSSLILVNSAAIRKTRAQWAAELGLTPGAISYRLRMGWSVINAITTPKLKDSGPS